MPPPFVLAHGPSVGPVTWQRGWPVLTAPGGHLCQIVDPPAVAAAILAASSAWQ